MYFKMAVSSLMLTAVFASQASATFPNTYFESFNEGLPSEWQQGEPLGVNWTNQLGPIAGNALKVTIPQIRSTARYELTDTFPKGRIRFNYNQEIKGIAANAASLIFGTGSSSSTLYGMGSVEEHTAEVPAGEQTLSIFYGLRRASWSTAYVDNLRFIADAVDTDKDFMEDSWELTHSLDPNTTTDGLEDADGDGVTNELEYWNNTDPNSSDTDSDGLSDLFEIRYGFDPTVITDTTTDLDGDGLSVQLEATNGSHPFIADTDEDGLLDGVEVQQHGTLAYEPDTDFDGYTDQFEILTSTDPLDTNDFIAPVTKFQDGFNVSLSPWWQTIPGETPFKPKASCGHGFCLVPDVTNTTRAKLRLVNNFSQGNLFIRYRAQNERYISQSNLSLTMTGTRSKMNSFYRSNSWTEKVIPIDQGTQNITFHYSYDWQYTSADEYSEGEYEIDEVRFLSITKDADADGMGDEWEAIHLSGPGIDAGYNYDPDNDGLSNREEYWRGTLPLVADTDGDTLPDGWETLNGLNPNNAADAELDSDGDTLTNSQEFAALTNPQKADTDDDGLDDYVELNTHNTDPTTNDTDQDGLSDGLEVSALYQTDPNNADTDNDGTNDGGEVTLGFDPKDGGSFPTTISFLHENFNDSNQSLLSLKNAEMPEWSFLKWGSDRAFERRYSVIVPEATLSTVQFSGYFEEGILTISENHRYVDIEYKVNGIPVTSSDRFNGFTYHFAEGGYIFEISVTGSHDRYSGEYSIANVHFLANRRDTNINKMDDQWELQYGLSSRGSSDKDSDGLSNYNEYRFNLDPTVADFDQDGLPDGIEYSQDLNPFDATDALTDLDSDKLSNLEEYNLGLYLDRADSDSDGLSDYDEVKVHFSDGKKRDTDGDGLDDGSEVNTYLTSPSKADSDNDGFADNVEIKLASDPTDNTSMPTVITDRFYSFENGTPNDWEDDYGRFVPTNRGAVDGDKALSMGSNFSYSGILKLEGVFADSIVSVYGEANAGQISLSRTSPSNIVAEEKFNKQEKGILRVSVSKGLNTVSVRLLGERYSEEHPTIDALRISLLDTDQDGIPNYWENKLGLNELSAVDATQDLDADGLNNLNEYLAGSDMYIQDTDTDGLPDNWEYFHGTKVIEIDHLEDYDQDGLTNFEEHEAGTNPQMIDSDQDQMPDGWEISYGLNPNIYSANEDHDGDGLTDLQEYNQGTNPTLKEVVTEPKADKKSGSLGLWLIALLPLIMGRRRHDVS